ncbi:TPA: type II toxin-antitoxin system HicB family antitoxin, partial [Neisseria gonorrhoeae]
MNNIIKGNQMFIPAALHKDE